MASAIRLRYVGPHDAIEGVPGVVEPIRRGTEFSVAPEVACSLLEQAGNFEAVDGEPRRKDAEEVSA